jgi:hypothetical protein
MHHTMRGKQHTPDDTSLVSEAEAVRCEAAACCGVPAVLRLRACIKWLCAWYHILLLEAQGF